MMQYYYDSLKVGEPASICKKTTIIYKLANQAGAAQYYDKLTNVEQAKILKSGTQNIPETDRILKYNDNLTFGYPAGNAKNLHHFQFEPVNNYKTGLKIYGREKN